MAIDARQGATPPAAAGGAKKGGRATDTYNWQTGEIIMATFAALSAAEKISTSQNDQRYVLAGSFYRQYIKKLPSWGLWWAGTGPTSVKTPDDSIRVRTDEQIYKKGWDMRGLLDKMTGLFADLWRQPEDAPDDAATFTKTRSGKTDVEWWEECEDKAAERWQKKAQSTTSKWTSYKVKVFPWLFRFACPDSPYLTNVHKFSARVKHRFRSKDEQASLDDRALEKAHAFFAERAGSTSLCAQWIINPNQRVHLLNKGATDADQQEYANVVASTGQDHRTPASAQVVMGGGDDDPDVKEMIQSGREIVRENKLRRREQAWMFNAWLAAKGQQPIDFAALHAAADAEEEARAAEADAPTRSDAPIHMPSMDDAVTPVPPINPPAARDDFEDDDDEQEEAEEEMDAGGPGSDVDPVFGEIRREPFTLLPNAAVDVDRTTLADTQRATPEAAAQAPAPTRASGRTRKPVVRD